MQLLTYILYLVLIVGAASIYLTVAWAQENTTAPPPPIVTTPVPQIKVSPPANVATTPVPNLQYLPQKAFIQAFNPEVAPTTPTSIVGPLPLQTGQQPVVTTTTTAPPAAGGIDVGSIMGILGAVMAAGTGFYAKLKGNQVNKVQETSQSNAKAIVDSKVVEQEIARYMFNLDKAKADALNDAPAIKLETLEDNKKEATETATKA